MLDLGPTAVDFPVGDSGESRVICHFCVDRASPATAVACAAAACAAAAGSPHTIYALRASTI